ncbi:MAG: hypothetical protein D6790_19230 [Caldilineae bacterium]|nr:MAG: hypothetical protein D6790_19230 [Caldilineae bacterium]
MRQVEYMWDGSDHISGKNDYGMTATGLYRYMLPSYRSMNFNKYGFPDEKRNMKYIMAVRQAALASGDQKQYLGEVRKMPNTFQEAIMSSAVTNTFSNLVVTLAERAELLKAGLADDRVVRGRLEWTDGNDSDVVFVPSESGHWLMLKEYTSEEQAPKWFKPNNVSRYPGMIIPHGGDTFGIGVDPYAKSKANQAVQSNGAIAVFRKFDPMDERNSDMFVAVYCHRPHSLYEFYDEVLKGATYFGCPFLHEDNVSGIEDMALSRGYKQFLHTLPGRRSSGITSNHVTKPRLISFMEGYIEECVDKIYFIDLIEELIEYDAEDSHRFDLAAAAMIALMMCHRSRVDGVGLWGKKDDVRRYEDIYRSFIDISVF